MRTCMHRKWAWLPPRLVSRCSRDGPAETTLQHKMSTMSLCVHKPRPTSSESPPCAGVMQRGAAARITHIQIAANLGHARDTDTYRERIHRIMRVCVLTSLYSCRKSVLPSSAAWKMFVVCVGSFHKDTPFVHTPRVRHLMLCVHMCLYV